MNKIVVIRNYKLTEPIMTIVILYLKKMTSPYTR